MELGRQANSKRQNKNKHKNLKKIFYGAGWLVCLTYLVNGVSQFDMNFMLFIACNRRDQIVFYLNI